MKIKWTHQIELPSGVTPGQWSPNYEQYGLSDIDFKNKRVLDIGCLDGLYSFYSEKRGAKDVVAIDINDTNEGQFGKEFNTSGGQSTGFLYAHKALKSKVKYLFPYSVYDLDEETLGIFDVVLCLGVIYHLAHPILALEKINQVTKKGGILVVESEISNTFTTLYRKLQFNHGKIENIPETQQKIRSTSWNYFIHHPAKGRVLRTFIQSLLETLLWKIVGHIFADRDSIYKGDSSNFFIMDDKTIERIIDFTGFRIEKKIPNSLSNRMTYVCKKIKEINSFYAHNSFSKKKYAELT